MYIFRIAFFALTIIGSVLAHIVYSVQNKTLLNEALNLAYFKSEEIEINNINFLHNVHLKHEAITKFLPDISLGYKLQAQGDLFSPSSFKSNSDTARPSIQLQQNLFRGGQDLVQTKSIMVGLEKALLDHQISEQEIILKMIEAYIDYIYSQHHLQISSENFQAYSTKLAYILEKYSHGEVTLVDMEIAKASYAKAQQEKYSAENNLEKAKSRFFVYFKFWPQKLEIPNISLTKFTNISSLINSIVKDNLQIKSTLKDLQSTKYELHSSRLRFLPSIDFAMSHQFLTAKNTDLIASKNKIELSINMPIVRAGGADFVNVKKMNKKFALKKNQYWRMSKEIFDQVKSKLEEFNNLIEKIQSNQAAIRSSRISVEAMNQEYLIGARTLIDVLNEQEKLNKYLVEDIVLHKNLLMSYYFIKSLEGKLLMNKIDSVNTTSYFDPNHHI